MPRQRYFTEGSKEEREAREALALLLRGQEPLSGELREILAALFDPAPTPMAHPAGVRELRFSFRGMGQRRDHWANSAIAKHVLDAVHAGGSVASGVAGAAERFKIEERWVKKIWSRYQKVAEAACGAAPIRGWPKLASSGHYAERKYVNITLPFPRRRGFLLGTAQ